MVCESKGERVGPKFLFKVVTWGQERGNFLLRGITRIHLSAPKITLGATYVFKFLRKITLAWKDKIK